MSIPDPLFVCFGAVPGALCRYYGTISLARRFGTAFPWGTFAINLSGAFLMGMVTTLAIERVILSPQLLLLLTTGFLGSYTTFSTYALDTSILWRSDRRVFSVIYGVGSVVLGGIGFEMGTILARAIG
jgi:fluoride exporter